VGNVGLALGVVGTGLVVGGTAGTAPGAVVEAGAGFRVEVGIGAPGCGAIVEGDVGLLKGVTVGVGTGTELVVGAGTGAFGAAWGFNVGIVGSGSGFAIGGGVFDSPAGLEGTIGGL